MGPLCSWDFDHALAPEVDVLFDMDGVFNVDSPIASTFRSMNCATGSWNKSENLSFMGVKARTVFYTCIRELQ